MKKIISIILASILLSSVALGLIGCSETKTDTTTKPKESSNASSSPATDTSSLETSSSETSKTGSNSGKTLQFMWFSDGNEGEVMKEMLAAYKEETGVDIELVEVGYQDSVAKIQAMIQGGEAPALARVAALPIFKDSVVDLKGVIDPSLYATSSQGLIKTDSGKVIGLPLDASANGMIYNKDLFDKYKIEIPTSVDDVWTWTEFKKEMEKLKGQEDVKYPGLYDFTPFRFGSMVYQYGGRFMDGETPMVNSAEFKNAVKNFISLHEDKILDPTVWAGSGDPASLFATGQYGFHIGGSWLIQGNADLKFNWSVTYLPTGETPEGMRATSGGGKYLAAFEGSGQEQEAKDFLAWFAAKEKHFEFSAKTLLINPRIDGDEVEFPSHAVEYKIFSEELQQIPTVMVQDAINPFIEGVYPLVKEAIAKAIAGGEDVDTLMDDLAETITLDVVE